MPPPYKAPGRCIYCGEPPTKSDELTEEHIIPLGLGGKWKLPHASCLECRDITSALETHCIKGMFYAAKGHFKIKGRKSRRAPDFLRLGVEHDTLLELRKMHVSTHPGAIMGFDYGESGASMGFMPSDHFVGGKFCITTLVDDFWQRLARVRSDRIKLTPSSINSELFARMLAKIAHAYAVAELGIDGFEHVLCNAVRGITPMYLPYYIGTVDGKLEPVSEARHELSIARNPNWVDTELLTVRLRLFSQKQTPIYYIVVSKPEPKPRAAATV